MRRQFLLIATLIIVGCDVPSIESPSSPDVSAAGSGQGNAPVPTTLSTTPANVGTVATETKPSLMQARRGFQTNIIRAGEPAGPAVAPIGTDLELIHFRAPVGELAAYLSRDPGDGLKHPAIVWIAGGDTNSVGDVWSPADRSNDQSARAFRQAGIITMYPSQRGGNDNPGQREGFFGEVDDILAATDHLASLPYVHPEQIYLGGHSTGGTLVMLVGECSDRYRAIFSLGPAASPVGYGGSFMYCDLNDKQEVSLRSPIEWLHGVRSPLYVFEGGARGNWDSIQLMAEHNSNPQIKFFKVEGQDHFSVIAPLTELLARQIAAQKIDLSPEMLRGLR